jgi:hypothetical protein
MEHIPTWNGLGNLEEETAPLPQGGQVLRQAERTSHRSMADHTHSAPRYIAPKVCSPTPKCMVRAAPEEASRRSLLVGHIEPPLAPPIQREFDEAYDTNLKTTTLFLPSLRFAHTYEINTVTSTTPTQLVKGESRCVWPAGQAVPDLGPWPGSI